jgi:hypothetical protein
MYLCDPASDHIKQCQTVDKISLQHLILDWDSLLLLLLLATSLWSENFSTDIARQVKMIRALLMTHFHYFL